MMDKKFTIFFLTSILFLSFSSCSNPKKPEKETFSVTQASISDQDSVQIGSELVIRFSSPVDIESFSADSIISEKAIGSGVEQSKTTDSTTLSLSVIGVESSSNITLNDEPQSFWYDPNTHSCAFIKVTTVPLPEGTGEGFYLDSENRFVVSSDLSSVTGAKLESDFTLTIHTNGYTHIGIIPNPYFATSIGGSGTSLNIITFKHLPQICDIIIYDIFGNKINTIHHENESSEFEKWDLTSSSGAAVPSGIYRYEVGGDEVTFSNGVIVINK